MMLSTLNVIIFVDLFNFCNLLIFFLVPCNQFCHVSGSMNGPNGTVLVCVHFIDAGYILCLFLKNMNNSR